MGRLLACALDELDYGILLLDANSQVLHLNRRARRLLEANHPLQLLAAHLRTRDPRETAILHDALQVVAGRGLRKLLSFGEGASRQLAALVPVETGVAALMLGKDRVCEDLSIQAFARTFSLTSAETRVLVALGSGARPTEIARDQGVKLSTIRTQIGAIREKTGAEGITALVRLVAALPPMVGALRA